MSTTQAELVFVPLPIMGHLLSTVELAKLIIGRDEHILIFIYIINLPNKTTMLQTFVEAQSCNNPYPTRLTFITLPPLYNPPDPSSLGPAFYNTLVTRYVPVIKQALEERVKVRLSRLSGFIFDMFCTPMIDIAVHFDVPSYIFFTSGACLLNLAFHFESLMMDDHKGVVSIATDPEIEFDVPGFMNRVNEKAFPTGFPDKENGSSVIIDHVRMYNRTHGIIVNTFVELETCGVQALLEQVGKGRIRAIYPVGPILKLDDNASKSGTHGEEYESIMKWLDDQPSSSVVFLCFGSMGSFDADQVKEIANGLEKSSHRFLWSLRKPLPLQGKVEALNEEDTFVKALPESFLHRTANRGKIIGWAPQVSILAHSSIGGFVSHCGWNSTLESVWFGVPMATWPLYAEQQLNAFELVKELGLAVEIRMDYRQDSKTGKANFQVTAEEIENGVKKLMSLDEKAKNKAREMRDKGRKTLQDGGSSHHWLGRFIEDVLGRVA